MTEPLRQQFFAYQAQHGAEALVNNKTFQKMLKKIKKNTTSYSKVFDMSRVAFLPETFKQLCGPLVKNTYFESLLFCGCDIRDGSINELAKLLSENKSLTEVDLTFNCLTNSSIDKIKAAIKANPRLAVVRILGNDCGALVENELQGFLNQRKISRTVASSLDKVMSESQAPSERFEEKLDEPTQWWLQISEDFFKGINLLLKQRLANKCGKKELFKTFSELLNLTIKDFTPFVSSRMSVSFSDRLTWEDIFHGYFVGSADVVSTSAIEDYLRLIQEYLVELNMRIAKEEGKANEMKPWNESQSLVLSSVAPAVNFLAPSFEKSNTSPSLLGGCAPIGFTSRSQKYQNLLQHCKALLQFLAIHKVDAVNSLMGSKPSASLISRHFSDLQAAADRFAKKQITRVSNQFELETNSIDSKSTSSNEHSPSSTPRSGSPLSISSMSSSRGSSPRGTTAAISQYTQPEEAHDNASLSQSEIERRLIEWSKCKEEDAVSVLRQIQDLVSSIKGSGPPIEAGDLIVVRERDTLVYGRAIRIISPGSLTARISLYQPGMTFSRSDVAPLPPSLIPLLQTFASAKRLIENPVEEFYRDIVSRVKDAVLNYLAVKLLNVDLLERAVLKQILLSDNDALIRLQESIRRVIEEGVEPVIEKLEVYHTIGMHEIRKSITSNPLLREAAKSITDLNVKVVVIKRLSDYYQKVSDAIEYLHTERRAMLTGTKKTQLSEWWLQAIHEKVFAFLKEYKYDPEAIPADYISEPPKSVWKVQRNLEIVRRWLRPSTLEDKQTLEKIITSISSQVYYKLDRFIHNVEYIVLQELSNFDAHTPKAPYILSQGEDAALKKIADLKSSLERYADRMTSPLNDQLKNMLLDCEYIIEMKALDAEADQSRGSQKYVISRAVPVNGLVVGAMARAENELNTCLEIWLAPGRTKYVTEKKIQNFFGNNGDFAERPESTKEIKVDRGSERQSKQSDPLKRMKGRSSTISQTVEREEQPALSKKLSNFFGFSDLSGFSPSDSPPDSVNSTPSSSSGSTTPFYKDLSPNETFPRGHLKGVPGVSSPLASPPSSSSDVEPIRSALKSKPSSIDEQSVGSLDFHIGASFQEDENLLSRYGSESEIPRTTTLKTSSPSIPIPTTTPPKATTPLSGTPPSNITSLEASPARSRTKAGALPTPALEIMPTATSKTTAATSTTTSPTSAATSPSSSTSEGTPTSTSTSPTPKSGSPTTQIPITATSTPPPAKKDLAKLGFRVTSSASLPLVTREEPKPTDKMSKFFGVNPDALPSPIVESKRDKLSDFFGVQKNEDFTLQKKRKDKKK